MCCYHMIKWRSGTETIFYRRPSVINTPRKAQKGKGPWYMAIWHIICECQTTDSAHLQVGSQEERIVPGNLVPAQIISQDEDDVRPSPCTGLPWVRGGGLYNQVTLHCWPTEPVNTNTSMRPGNMISLLHPTVALLLKLEPGVSLNSPP